MNDSSDAVRQPQLGSLIGLTAPEDPNLLGSRRAGPGEQSERSSIGRDDVVHVAFDLGVLRHCRFQTAWTTPSGQDHIAGTKFRPMLGGVGVKRVPATVFASDESMTL